MFAVLGIRLDIAGIVLNRWGHAFVNPQLGFFFGIGGKPAARSSAKQPFGRIAFANTDLSGTMAAPERYCRGSSAVYPIWGAVS
jgi:spermidine dehydrogenase